MASYWEIEIRFKKAVGWRALASEQERRPMQLDYHKSASAMIAATIGRSVSSDVYCLFEYASQKGSLHRRLRAALKEEKKKEKREGEGEKKGKKKW